MIYTENKIDTDTIRRAFTVNVDSDELVWHRDKNDRYVTVIKGGGWKFQEEDELPITLTDGMCLYIPKERYHRVHKGSDELIVEIKEIK